MVTIPIEARSGTPSDLTQSDRAFLIVVSAHHPIRQPVST